MTLLARPLTAAFLTGQQLLAGVALCLIMTPSQAADALCAQPTSLQPAYANPAELKRQDPNSIVITAEQASLGNDGVTVLQGDVAMSREDGVLYAERLKHEQATQQISAEGQVTFSNGEIELRGRQAKVDVDNNEAEFNGAEFQLSNNARGSAEQIKLGSDGTPELQKVRYTTCPAGQEDWVLQADEIELDHKNGQGKARKVSVRFKDIPLLYLPYLQFPISDQPQSGFLAPEVGSSGVNGVELSLPYYWYIAPNLDATITPGLYSRRGLHIQSELRGITGTPLSQRGNSQWWQAYGKFDSNYLPSDTEYGGLRYLIGWNSTLKGQNRNISWAWNTELVDVSDIEWFDDFGTTLTDISQPFYTNRTEAQWQRHSRTQTMRAQLIAEDFDTLGDVSNLISRQPQIAAQLRQYLLNSGLYTQISSNLSRFGNRDADNTTERAHANVALGWEHRQAAWWASAEAAWLQTYWTTEDNNSSVNQNRGLPRYKAQLGGHLERDYQWGYHVIEPTVSFRAAPYREQSTLPLLDSHQETLYWHNLNGDQYSGIDRIGDGQQLSVVLGNYGYQANGNELWNVRLGQIWYLEQAQVTIPGESLRGRRSHTLFETQLQLSSRWKVAATGEWDNQGRELDHSQLRVELEDPVLGDFYLSLRHRNQLYKQLSLGGKRQINNHWSAEASSLYSIDDNRALAAHLKLSYQSCCWGISFGGSRVLRDSSGEPDIGFFVQLELSGLIELGND